LSRLQPPRKLIISNGHSCAITGCTSLASISSPSHGELQGRGTDTLVLSLKHDVAILREFARIFTAAAQSDQIPSPDKLSLNEVCLASCPASLASTPPSSAEDGGAHGVARQEGRR